MDRGVSTVAKSIGVVVVILAARVADAGEGIRGDSDRSRVGAVVAMVAVSAYAASIRLSRHTKLLTRYQEVE